MSVRDRSRPASPDPRNGAPAIAILRAVRAAGFQLAQCEIASDPMPKNILSKPMARRDFLSLLAATTATLSLPGCGETEEPGRYTEADIERLARQRARELEQSGHGPFGVHRYRGYRGLAELPWFELDDQGVLRCVAEDVPLAIDMHCHLGISLLFAPDIDLLARTPRVQHLLDCDGQDPGCPLDLDVYMNANFTPEDLRALRSGVVRGAFFGSPVAQTHTVPNLLAEMDASRIAQAVVLPIAFGLPFGDDLSERYIAAIRAADAQDRLILGASVHPRDRERIPKLERLAAEGTRVVKLHPTMQRFYPDDPDVMEIYAACERLGLIVFFHCGRAGIEPESSHRYALPRHYEGALASFPELPFVLGHSGARDVDSGLAVALRHENAWLDIHGQGITKLDEIVRKTGGERLLFGTDWPFYHVASSLAKVLIVSEGDDELRYAILRGNAERLLGESREEEAIGRARETRGSRGSQALHAYAAAPRLAPETRLL